MISDRCVSCCRGLPVANHCQSSFLSDYRSPFKEILHLEGSPALLLDVPVDNGTIDFAGIEFLVEVPPGNGPASLLRAWTPHSACDRRSVHARTACGPTMLPVSVPSIPRCSRRMPFRQRYAFPTFASWLHFVIPPVFAFSSFFNFRLNDSFPVCSSYGRGMAPDVRTAFLSIVSFNPRQR